MITGSLSRRYAKALFSIGLQTNTLPALGQELEQLAHLYQNSLELKQTLENQIFPMSQRKQVLASVCQKLNFSKTLTQFALLLLERGRISSLVLTSYVLRSLIDEQLGQLRIQITTAANLDPQVEARLKEALEKTTKKTILFEKNQDPQILGGLKLQLGDAVYDASLIAKLENLRETLQHVS